MSNLENLLRAQQEKEKIAGIKDRIAKALAGAREKMPELVEGAKAHKGKIIGGVLAVRGGLATAVLLRKLLKARAAKKSLIGAKGSSISKAYKSWKKMPTNKKALVAGGGALGAGGLGALLAS